MLQIFGLEENRRQTSSDGELSYAYAATQESCVCESLAHLVGSGIRAGRGSACLVLPSFLVALKSETKSLGRKATIYHAELHPADADQGPCLHDELASWSAPCGHHSAHAEEQGSATAIFPPHRSDRTRQGLCTAEQHGKGVPRYDRIRWARV